MPKRRRADNRRRDAALRPAAPLARGAGSARSTSGGANLPPDGPGGFRARPRDQGDRPAAHAGAAGLDLRLAGVRLALTRRARTRLVDSWCLMHRAAPPRRPVLTPG